MSENILIADKEQFIELGKHVMDLMVFTNLDLQNQLDLEKTLEVTDELSAKNALSIALQSRKLEKTIEKSRQEIIKPHLDYQRAVNKIVKDIQEKLNSMEKSLETKILSWMNDTNPFSSDCKIEVEDGTFSKSESWTFEITDPDLIPREFLKPDENKIQEAIDLGLRSINGTKIKLSQKAKLRCKN